MDVDIWQSAVPHAWKAGHCGGKPKSGLMPVLTYCISSCFFPHLLSSAGIWRWLTAICPILLQSRSQLLDLLSCMVLHVLHIKVKCLTDSLSLFVSLCLSPCGRPAPKASSEQGSSSDKKERPMSTMSEASNYTGGSDYSTFPASPATTVTTATTTSTSSTRVSLHPNIC